jgi:hypothetical protein
MFGRKLLAPVRSGFRFRFDSNSRSEVLGIRNKQWMVLKKHNKQNPTGKTQQCHEYNLSVVVK